MQTSNKPSLIPVPFANSGTKNTIPTEASPTPGLASLTTGFPPVTMTPIAAGGIPPTGADFNGILNLLSAVSRWSQAGGMYTYDSTFANSTYVNGYPLGAVLSRIDGTGQWLSTAENNKTNPEDSGSTSWVPGYNYGSTTLSGLTNANITLTRAQASKRFITLSGTLTGNIQLIFPAWIGEWEIYNGTTGSYSVTATTGTGSGVVLVAGQQKVMGDGTYIWQPPEGIAVATQPTQAAQLQQMYGKSVRFTSSGTVTVPAGVTKFYLSGCGGGGGGAGGSGATASQGAGGGAGGSAAQSAVRTTVSVSPGDVISVTIGAAGTGGAAGATGGGGSVGTTGGNTVFTNTTTGTTLLTLLGGTGGNGSSGNISFGGIAGTSQAYPAGSCGVDSISTTSTGAGGGNGGAGASGPFGGGGGSVRGNNGTAGIAGYDAGGYGAGGGGGGGCYTWTAVAGGKGGNGTAGLAIIEV